MADNILSDFGINILEEEIDDVIFQTNEFLTDATFTGSQGPFWWLPLPIFQNTTLIAVNQPLANSCLVAIVHHEDYFQRCQRTRLSPF